MENNKQLEDNKNHHHLEEEHKYDYNHFMTTKTKKEEEDQLQKDFKLIRNRNQGKLDKSELWLFFEYTEFEKEIVIYLIENYKLAQIRELKRDLVKNPKLGYKNLNYVIQSYCQSKGIKNWDKYRQERDEKLQNEAIDQEEEKNDDEMQNEDIHQKQKDIEPGVIMHLNNVIVLQIIEYCEPRSLGNIQCTCRRFRELAQSKFLFKKYCMLLYQHGQIQLPEKNYFTDFQNSVISNPLQFNPTYITQVSTNVRQVVWPEKDNFKVPVSYFKQFKSWYDMYKSAPRLNYGGVYKIKERSLKMGEIEFNHHHAPILEIIYFRYVRFMPNGSLRYKVCSKKLTNQQIAELFTNEDEQFCKTNQIYLGEYIQAKDKVILKYALKSTIFEYELRIQHDESKPNYLLRVEKQVEKSPEINHTYILYQLGPYITDKYFKYKPIEKFRDDLRGSKISAITL